MLATTLALAIASLPAIFAQNTFNVQVGQNSQLTYDPTFVNASPGDLVNFIFNPKAHTVTQSSFNTPCIAASGGADTGFVNVTAGQSPLPIRQFQVPSGTAPLWFYCRQVGHCGQGMVFAINPPTTGNTFQQFQANAIAQNGTSSSTAPSAASTSVPPPTFATATATVTYQGSTYTTTYTSYAGTPPPTPAANPVTHTITVGDGGLLAYNAPNITASIGDTVVFEFHPKNHTVTQSNFGSPCKPLQQSTGNIGFDSGFTPVATNATTFPTFSIRINDTAPIWGYCAQTGHCTQGMVFAINAVESGPNTFEAFKALAIASGGSSSSSASGTGTSTGTSPSSTGGAVAAAGFGNVGLMSVLAVAGVFILAL